MVLPFSELCTLLSQYEDIELRDSPVKAARLTQVTESWFKSHRCAIDDSTTEASVALLSALLPERRTERVYGLQAARLSKMLGRALRLGFTRTRDLHAYTDPGKGDLATCLARVIKAGGPPALPAVTLEEVDELCRVLASHCPFSANYAKDSDGQSPGLRRDDLLGNVLMRLQSDEAKWLVRIILKDLSPVRIDERQILGAFHFLLPSLLRFQNNFETTIGLLKGLLSAYPSQCDPKSEILHRKSVAKLLKPAIGVKVGRPNFVKARSIDNCIGMVGHKSWVLERKYDGEYCEIHIDLQVSNVIEKCIRIFSKSSKDSTDDRKAIIPTLCESFKLGCKDCKIKQKAIVLGELVVYSDNENVIMPFEEIRKHVTRAGRHLGTSTDAVPKSGERLAIVLFDLLLLDNDIVMTNSVDIRRLKLRNIYRKIPGRVIGAQWTLLDFAHDDRARMKLVAHFAVSIAERCEGLILKPCGSPYFDLDSDNFDPALSFVKLKKDYMLDLGDEADFAVVGGSYNAQLAARCKNIAGLKWTTFHLGCLTNKDDVLRFGGRPSFKIVGTVDSDLCIPRHALQAANTLGQFVARPLDSADSPSTFDITNRDNGKMQVYFETPFVFEVLGSGFVKPSNSKFLMLRHPRVKKLHHDRSWKDCISFDELQALAENARERPKGGELQETLKWIEKLEQKYKKQVNYDQANAPVRPVVSTSPAMSKAMCVKSSLCASKRPRSFTTPVFVQEPGPGHTAPVAQTPPSPTRWTRLVEHEVFDHAAKRHRSL